MSVRSVSKVQLMAIVAAFCAAFALSGCGRKGGLDAPPSALNNKDAGTEVTPTTEESGTLQRPGTDKLLPVIRGPNKRIPLDALLD